jgi:hypothetical protein
MWLIIWCIIILLCLSIYNTYSYLQLKTDIDNDIINNNKIKTDIDKINNIIDIDHSQNDNNFKDIKNQLNQTNNLIIDLNKSNTSDHLLFDRKIFDIIIDKTTNWNYGNQLPKYDNFEKWPTRLAFIDTDDTFRPVDIMNHEALGIKITSANSISESWIILSLENNSLYSRTKNIQEEMSEWKSLNKE